MTLSPETVQTASRYADLTPCSDGSCIFRVPVGMSTNGGCICSEDLCWKGQAGYPITALALLKKVVRLMRDEIARLTVQMADRSEKLQSARDTAERHIAESAKLRAEVDHLRMRLGD